MTAPGREHRRNAVGARARGSSCTELRLRVAAAFLPRLLGLYAMGPLAPDEGLLLYPCRAVHTFFLRERIDVVFLDEAGAICRHVPSMKSRRVAVEKRARMVVELSAGYCRRHPDHLARIHAALRQANRLPRPS